MAGIKRLFLGELDLFFFLGGGETRYRTGEECVEGGGAGVVYDGGCCAGDVWEKVVVFSFFLKIVKDVPRNAYVGNCYTLAICFSS